MPFSSFLASLSIGGMLAGSTLVPANEALQSDKRLITRAEAVTSLLLVRTDDVPFFPIDPFISDIEPKAWYARYVQAAVQYGIIAPDPYLRTVRPYSGVTRAELLVMIARTFGLQSQGELRFDDVLQSAWYAPYAGIARRLELFPDALFTNVLRPGQRVQAGELTQIVTRLKTMKEEAGTGGIFLELMGGPRNVQLYTVTSTKKQNVVLVDPSTQSAQQSSASLRGAAPSMTLAQLRTQVMNLVNEQRSIYGLRALTYNQTLDASAQNYAERLARENFFSHTAPDGETLKDRIERQGYGMKQYNDTCRCITGYSLGENLARGQKTAAEVVRDWVISPEHRKAILDPDYTDTGIGIYGGIWVQHFGGILLP